MDQGDRSGNPPQGVQDLLDAAARFYMSGDYQSALRTWERVLEAEPSNVRAREGIKKTHMLLVGDGQEARAPSEPVLAEVESLLARRRFDEAVRLCREHSSAAGPALLSALHALLQRAERARAVEPEIQRCLESARRSIQEGKPRDALSHLKQVLTLDRLHPVAARLMVAIRERARRRPHPSVSASLPSSGRPGTDAPPARLDDVEVPEAPLGRGLPSSPVPWAEGADLSEIDLELTPIDELASDADRSRTEQEDLPEEPTTRVRREQPPSFAAESAMEDISSLSSPEEGPPRRGAPAAYAMEAPYEGGSWESEELVPSPETRSPSSTGEPEKEPTHGAKPAGAASRETTLLDASVIPLASPPRERERAPRAEPRIPPPTAAVRRAPKRRGMLLPGLIVAAVGAAAGWWWGILPFGSSHAPPEAVSAGGATQPAAPARSDATRKPGTESRAKQKAPPAGRPILTSTEEAPSSGPGGARTTPAAAPAAVDIPVAPEPQAARPDHQTALALFEEGQDHLKAGRTEAAVDVFRRAVELDPANPEIASWQAKASARLEEERRQEIEQRAAIEAFHAKEFDTALRKFYRLQQKDPDGPYDRYITNGWYNWGLQLLSAGNLREASAKLDEALAMNPKDAGAHAVKDLIAQYENRFKDRAFYVQVESLHYRALED